MPAFPAHSLARSITSGLAPPEGQPWWWELGLQDTAPRYGPLSGARVGGAIWSVSPPFAETSLPVLRPLLGGVFIRKTNCSTRLKETSTKWRPVEEQKAEALALPEGPGGFTEVALQAHPPKRNLSEYILDMDNQLTHLVRATTHRQSCLLRELGIICVCVCVYVIFL